MFYVSAKNPNELKKKLLRQYENGAELKDIKVYVTSRTREHWIMEQENVTMGHEKYGVYFIDFGDGIWEACIDTGNNTKQQMLTED